MRNVLNWISGLVRPGGPSLKEYGVNELTSKEDFERVLAASAEAPQFIFKHSTSCPISASAHRRVAEYLEEAGGEAPAFSLVKVIESRPVSNEIASRLGVQHQSPQLLQIRDGEAVWNASHGSITADAINSSLSKP